MDCAPNKVLSELEEVRFFITKPENIFIHMAANMETLTAAGQAPSLQSASALTVSLRPYNQPPLFQSASTLAVSLRL